MPHITIKVSPELLEHTRRAAANRNLTVSALLRNFLTTMNNEPAKGRNDREVFDRYFPPQKETTLDIEFRRLVQQIERRAGR